MPTELQISYVLLTGRGRTSASNILRPYRNHCNHFIFQIFLMHQSRISCRITIVKTCYKENIISYTGPFSYNLFISRGRELAVAPLTLGRITKLWNGSICVAQRQEKRCKRVTIKALISVRAKDFPIQERGPAPNANNSCAFKKPPPSLSSHRPGRKDSASLPHNSLSLCRTLTGMTTVVPLGMISCRSPVSAIGSESGILIVSPAFRFRLEIQQRQQFRKGQTS